ncbi:MAG TPA: glycosyltransferase [Actinomycetota bacterium]|nr:glycosyltransferase [Actinomycetota bacterium]
MTAPRAPYRIAFVINSLETGGAERQLALTVAELDRSRFAPIVVTLFRAGAFREAVERAGVEVRDLGLPKSLWSAVRGARPALAELRPDLIHTAMFEANVAGRLAGRRLGVPVVSHATNTYDAPLRYSETPVPRWKLNAARRLEGWTARRSGARIVAVGEEVARSAAAYLDIPRSRVSVIRRGFDFRALEAASREPLEAPAWPDGASPRLLAVGRLAPQKGHRYLVEAMPAILDEHPRAHLTIAGGGPLEPELRSLAASLDLAERVTLAGVRRDVPALLAAADVFVLPSLWEGAAGALVEAMGLGVPVVSTDDPALREVAGNAASLVAARDAGALAGAVVELADDPAAARARAAGAVPRVRAAHDIQANTRALERVYEDVVEGRAAESTRPKRRHWRC